MIKLFKFLVQPVILETDEDGEPIAEHPGEPVTLYNREQFENWLTSLEAGIAENNADRATRNK